MNVLVIPEDFRKDQYILKPLFERLFRSFRKGRRARVRVCQEPALGGIGEALKSERILEIVSRYEGMTEIFILCVDRDGVATRRRRLDRLEGEFGNGRVFHRGERVGGTGDLGPGRGGPSAGLALGGRSLRGPGQGTVL